MAVPALSTATKSRISVAKAVMPGPHPDPNVGKTATMKSGYYQGLSGIVYPQYEGIKYIESVGGSYEGSSPASNKPYLLLFFFDDGTFFCGVDISPGDVNIVGGWTPGPSGSGTVADPYLCNSKVYAGSNSSTNYHQLPLDKKGTVFIEYDMYGVPDALDVYFITDLDNPIVSVPLKPGKGVASFYYDPSFHPNKIVVKVNKQGASGTGWEYVVRCPV
jgi:hypothetical protein